MDRPHLDGRKDWEMRSRPTSVRGWFGLVRKGGGAVVGLARLVECGEALDRAGMIANIERHRIPEDMIRRGEVNKWVVPWKLADVIPFERPVPYEHKSGPVTWVNFSPDVCRELTSRLDRRGSVGDGRPTGPARAVDRLAPLSARADAAGGPGERRTPDPAPTPPLPAGEHRELGRSVLSGGNIRNDHIKLAPLLHAFPPDVIGGSSKTEAAQRRMRIDWGGPEEAVSDIDGAKSIFRARAWVRRFFAASGARENDVVVFVETAPYRISVRLERGGAAT